MPRENPFAAEVIAALPENGSPMSASDLVAALYLANPQSQAASMLPQLTKAGFIVGELVTLENGNVTAQFSRKIVAPAAPVPAPRTARPTTTPTGAN